MNILRSTSIYAAALVLGAATTTVVLAGSAAHAVDPGPPTHYVVTELMASGDTGNKNFVSPNGRYLLIASDFGGDVYDLVAGESLGVVQGNGTVTLQPQGIDDSGVVVGGYSDTSPSPGLNTGFHWYGKDATHPLGHAVPEEVPGSLIGTYVPICNEPPDNGKFDEMSYYGVGGDGTAYGYAGCGGVAGLFAISRPTNGAVGISGGAQDVGTPQVSPNAALAYGVGENGDIVGAGSNSGLPLLTWSSSNPTPPS